MYNYELSIPHSELKMLAVTTDVYSPASFAAAKNRTNGCSILSRKLRSPPFAPPYRVFSRKLVVNSVFGGAEACVREDISSQNSIFPQFSADKLERAVTTVGHSNLVVTARCFR